MARLLILLALVLPFAATAQQGYPSKPIKMIIPLAAASAVDNAARIVTQKMSASMGQQIVIENIPGAAGQIGTDRVAKIQCVIGHAIWKGLAVNIYRTMLLCHIEIVNLAGLFAWYGHIIDV